MESSELGGPSVRCQAVVVSTVKLTAFRITQETNLLGVSVRLFLDCVTGDGKSHLKSVQLYPMAWGLRLQREEEASGVPESMALLPEHGCIVASCLTLLPPSPPGQSVPANREPNQALSIPEGVFFLGGVRYFTTDMRDVTII